ncbi:serine--tRNA ligase [Collibacillus ludicampi]|jgi:seryl-tRNA synthetase|uniref:Serine--tRNA ligase n=1 Tax=Collibacillus ludicampi TaxID=2771369 RepID=A0AAV4LH60_9BACL|nr:serine--tRNA ligase [Collibacillus ludicampi]GIM47185.1 serine--tRNA ligase [Collibacillus ludicampi]
MLDIHFIRNHPDKVQKAAEDKGIDISIEELLDLDRKRRQYIVEIEELRAERNKKSKLTPTLQGEEREANIQSVKQLNERLKSLESELERVKQQFDEMMLVVPAVPFDDVPVGKDDSENVELYTWGTLPVFDFTPRDHVTLGEMHDMFDIPRGVKIAGSRMFFLKNDAVLLQRAIQQMALDFIMDKGYEVFSVPVLVREDAMRGTGYLPLGREQAYVLERDELFLVGTSEVALVSYHADEILDGSELPKRMAGISDCFRREVGAAGKDTRGLYRVHQFQKIEQVALVKNDIEESNRFHKELLENAETILRMLELPYRVVEVCTGDMGQGQVKKHDIETWMPSRESYSETHSCSSFLDFQARRSNIRYRDENGNIQYVYTLNNTLVATPRLLIPLLEVHQQEDGSIRIPEALRKYMGGREKLIPKYPEQK